MIAIALAVLAFLVWASSDIRSPLYVRSFCKKKGGEKTVALTFDDGPDPLMTGRVLDVLERRRVRAAFFLIGRKARRHPELVRRIAAGGHLIGNHTYRHDFRETVCSVKTYRESLEKTDGLIRDIAGLRTRLYRPPFGVTNPHIGSAVGTRRISVGWSIRSLDTVSFLSRERVCRRVLDRLHPGAVILLHDRCRAADVLVDHLVKGILEKGYRIVSIEEMLAREVYEK